MSPKVNRNTHHPGRQGGREGEERSPERSSNVIESRRKRGNGCTLVLTRASAHSCLGGEDRKDQRRSVGVSSSLASFRYGNFAQVL